MFGGARQSNVRTQYDISSRKKSIFSFDLERVLCEARSFSKLFIRFQAVSGKKIPRTDRNVDFGQFLFFLCPFNRSISDVWLWFFYKRV